MTQEDCDIRIAVFIGSVRPGNMTAKASALIVDEINKHKDAAVEVIDPAEIELALPGTAKDSSVMDNLQQRVSDATGIIFATPEYHGSYSSVIKLIIEQLGYPSVLSGKPIALLGVAAGSIGAIKALEHLRSVCSHVGAIVLPGPVSVAAVHKVFDEKGKCTDPAMEQRIRGVATNLMDYIRDNICPRVALEQMVRPDR